jgi:hypothetical protein
MELFFILESFQVDGVVSEIRDIQQQEQERGRYRVAVSRWQH